MEQTAPASKAPDRPKLIDQFGREVTYVRLSITDRCDFRCVYCMAEEMEFLPRSEILSLEEIALVARAFVELGVSKIRLTGGEPLVRKGVVDLARSIGGIPGLGSLVMTTNGSRLATMAEALRAAGIHRVNISLDSLKPERFRELTRVGELQHVLSGIEAARQAGFESVKLNAVVLRNRNHDEVVDLVRFAVERELDISFIEEMPLGHVGDRTRGEEFYSSDAIRRDLAESFELLPSIHVSGGPARYWDVAGSRTRIGFISPHSENFCASCNRVRVTSEGRLLLCLGNEHAVDLRGVLRESGSLEAVKSAIQDAMALKPERHHFNLGEAPVILRHMNLTGG
jgi:cyclic pyranopterin phosphate synthase